MIAINKNWKTWRFGYEPIYSEEEGKTAHWWVFGPIAFNVWYR